MKYAVPVAGGELCAHFGHCEQFAFIDVDEEKKAITGKNLVTPPAHQPGVLPAWLADEGVNVVLAGGMGMNARNLLEQRGVQVVIGALEADPEKAVLNHVAGSLATGDNTCDH